MRLLTVGNMYPPHHLGGYELVWQQNVRHLRAAGHEARVLTTDYRRSERAAADEDPDVHRELRWYWRDHVFPPLSLRGRLAVERHNAAVLRRQLTGLAPDTVLFWSMGGMSLSLLEQVRRRDIPAVAVVCDDWMLYGPQVDGWTNGFRGSRSALAPLVEALTGLPARLRRRQLAAALFPSETIRARALAAGWRPVRSEVVNQGVDERLFPPSLRPDWSWRLLYAGRLDPRKGVETAILTLTMLPQEATLRIAGAGDEAYTAQLRGLAEANGLADRVRFGETPRDRLAAEYAQADALLFPVRWREPWGLVPLEAMSVGTPVLASGRGGSGEYLRDEENCLLVDADAGPKAWAAAMRRLAEDADLRRRLRAAGRQTVAAIDPAAFDGAVEQLAREAATAR